MIWDLETHEEILYSDMLSSITEDAISGNMESQGILERLWPECSWGTIKERLQCEGSTWYVFWTDGVRQFMADQKGEENE